MRAAGSTRTLLSSRSAGFAVVAVKASATGLRTHFKNARETGAALKGKTITQAQKYLQDGARLFIIRLI